MIQKIVHVSGKRKRSTARATLWQGNGTVRINNFNLKNFQPKVLRLKLSEPLILAKDIASNVDIAVRVQGGGSSAQADAARLAIARALVEYSGDEKLKSTFLEYDRHLLIADVRRKEACKPNDSKARKSRQKSYR